MARPPSEHPLRGKGGGEEGGELCGPGAAPQECQDTPARALSGKPSCRTRLNKTGSENR